MADSTEDGRALKMLTLIDESTKEILVIEVFRQIKSINIIKVLDELFIRKGLPEHIRSDNGPKFTAKIIRFWLKRVGVQTQHIELGCAWENEYNESFNGKLRDELLNEDVFTNHLEAPIVVERWRL